MFAERLKELREMCELSQSELGQVLGVTSQAISNYETGKREPKIPELIRMSEYFHVSVDYLIGNTDNINSPHREIFCSVIDCILAKNNAIK